MYYCKSHFLYYFLVTVKGILILAPEFLPNTLIVVVTAVVPVGNISFNEVAVIVNAVPIWVILNGAPDVVGVGVVEGKAVVSTPVPVNEAITFWLEIVIKYPNGSTVSVVPK